MRIIDKLKKLSPKYIAIAVTVMFALSALVARITKSPDSRSSLKQVAISKEETNEPAGGSTAELEKRKEQSILEEQKRLLGAVEKKVKEDIEQKKSSDSSNSKQPERSELPPPPDGYTANNTIEQRKQQLFNSFYNMQVTPGASGQKNTLATPKSDSANPQSAGSPMPPFVQAWKFYRGKVVSTVTTATPDAPVVVELTEVPLKGSLVIGKGKPNATMDRIDVQFDGLVIDGKKYQVKGSAYSVDMTYGVASSLIRHDIAQAEAAFITELGSIGLETMREDRTETSTSLFGQTQTQIKSENRLREGLLAGGAAAIGAAGKVITGTLARRPPVEIVLEKNTPVLVRFEM